MKYIVRPAVVHYLDELVAILFEKKYFSYGEDALTYVEELLDDIYKDLPTKQKKPAPEYFERYGTNMYYALFRKSRKTSWYVLFRQYHENGELVYQIRYITNNHVSDAKYFNLKE